MILNQAFVAAPLSGVTPSGAMMSGPGLLFLPQRSHDRLLSCLSSADLVSLLMFIAQAPVTLEEAYARLGGAAETRCRRLTQLIASGWLKQGGRTVRVSAAAAESVSRYFEELALEQDVGAGAREMCGHQTRRASSSDDAQTALVILSSPPRRRILEELTRGTKSVGELARALGIGHSLVSYHVKALKSVGLVKQDSGRPLSMCRTSVAGLAEFTHDLHLGGVLFLGRSESLQIDRRAARPDV